MRPPLPKIELPVSRWEYKELHQRDENYELVLEGGLPVIAVAWVVLYLALPRGEEICLEVEVEPFEDYLLPSLLEPSICFWRAIDSGDPLYPRRGPMLEALLEQKARYERLTG